MPRSTAKLRIVPPSATVGGDGADQQQRPREADRMLAFMFAEEARLKRQLRDVTAALESAREAYRKANGLLVLPRIDLLRTRFAPKPGKPQ